MADKSNSDDGYKYYLRMAISAFVSVTHIIAFFQIVICSRHLAVAFNIPPKNIGIYFPKLYGLRSVLMSMACGIEYGIYRIIQSTDSSSDSNNAGGSNDTAKDVRKYLSVVWFVLLTICEISFLCVLYFSKSVAFHNYIVLNLEGMFFGFFQMSILSLIPEFATYYMLSLYVSGTSIFIIQTIIDRYTKNSMLSVKIQAWICVICSVICVGIWPVRLFLLKDNQTTQQNTGSSGSNTAQQTSNQSTCGSNSTNKRSADGFYEHPSVTLDQYNGSKMEYLMKINSMSILKILTIQFTDLCRSLNSDAIENIRILIARLQQIREERQITYDVLVAIDLVILSLKSSCSPDQLLLLAELSLFLRIKVQIKIDQNQITEVSYGRGHSGFNENVVSPTNHLLYTYPGTGHTYNYLENEDGVTEKRIIPETPSRSRRTRRGASQSQTQQQSSFHEHLWKSLSQLMMFPIGSLVKDFLFPGVIPFALLERDKCHVISLITIIFLSVGPVTIFIMQQTLPEFKCDNTGIHSCWTFMIPKIVILIISLCAIHTKQSCTHKIRSSQPIVLFMTVVVLTCYGFLETMSFVGMAHYVKFVAKDTSLADLQAIHNVFGKFFRYFVYKFSVGYNKTRISAGFVLPNFKPPEPKGDNFCYWFKGAFSNGWKDLKSDFKMNIKQYLGAGPTPSKKSPIETLRYCDIFM